MAVSVSCRLQGPPRVARGRRKAQDGEDEQPEQAGDDRRQPEERVGLGRHERPSQAPRARSGCWPGRLSPPAPATRPIAAGPLNGVRRVTGVEAHRGSRYAQYMPGRRTAAAASMVPSGIS